MKQRSTRSFRPHACQRCGGTAYLERTDYGEEWYCLQCGRSVSAPRLEPGPERTRAA